MRKADASAPVRLLEGRTWRKAEIERLSQSLTSGKARNVEGARKTIQTHKSEIASLEREIAAIK